MSSDGNRLSIIVVGASGDLARKKIFPALFALYCQDFLPASFGVFGFARSAFSNRAFRKKIEEHLTCRYVPGESCAEKMVAFLSRCHYVSGQYDSGGSFLDLYEVMRRTEGGNNANRIFYLAIPPSVFVAVARAIGSAGLVNCGPGVPWSRVVVEKPFGRDRESSDLLTRELAQVFTEDQTYRIDHYLGKEVIQNLMVLRFANRIFEPIWNRSHIENVHIVWKEDIGVKGRAGYFEEYGIVRDVLQNHLMQILALVAMEPPARIDATSIADVKTGLLRCIPPLKTSDVLLGQYEGYLEEKGVAGCSLTPTFVSAVFRINNKRWKDVPFVVTAGKGLDACMTEVRMKFRDVPDNMFCGQMGCPEANELVVRVQPDEAIMLKIANKVPGMGMTIETRSLNLQYASAFDKIIPDAYESLLLDVMTGDRSLFIQKKELAAAWNIVTQVLHETEERRSKPELYEFGNGGPDCSGILG